MFADDTKLMNSSETLNDRWIGFDLVCLQNEISCNKLDLNVKKSELMGFCQPLTDIRLHNQRFTNSDSVKYLGIHLDKNFSPDVYVYEIVTRLSKHVFAVA